MKEKMIIEMLRMDTGCGMRTAAKAFNYAYERNIADYKLMLTYIKATGLAVSTPGLTFDERVSEFYRIEKKENTLWVI